MSDNRDVSDPGLQAGHFYGDVRKLFNESNLVLSEVSYKAGQRFPNHIHHLAHFSLLIKGEFAEYYGRKAYTYKPMTNMFHPPELEHWNQVGDHASKFFIVELGLDWIRRFEEYAPLPDRIVADGHGELAWLALRLFREVKAPHSFSRLAVEGLVTAMLAEVGSAGAFNEKRAPQWLIQATDLLRAEFNQNVTIARVATEVGVHPFHLSRVFRHFHRQTIGEYVKRMRVEYACGELCKPDRKLAAIAVDAGFNDQSHFTRAFKEVIGTTPRSFQFRVKTK